MKATLEEIEDIITFCDTSGVIVKSYSEKINEYIPKFECIVGETIITKERWCYKCYIIIKHIETEKLYKIEYYNPATEMQEGDYGYENIELIEVVPTFETITVYKELVE